MREMGEMGRKSDQITFHASFSATSGPISTGPGALESSACVCLDKNNSFDGMAYGGRQSVGWRTAE